MSNRMSQQLTFADSEFSSKRARLGRKSLSFSKSVELHDKVIGHYLNIKHYQ
ncbi:IS1 family transposase [Citrobacter portucalensis]|uniref:IS1 family transposase n=1 Tax=Citrobacter portucalensis TaxID=1639133 RepID=UPI00216A3029|nr:IS1 family transposase [Citrobacter portucalensis]